VMDELAGHLAERYGVEIDGLVTLDEAVYRVDGPRWVARWLPAGADASAAVTAELLRRLAPTKFPAERLAHPDPISVCGGRPVLVTEFVRGRQAPGTPRMFAVLGTCLGGLHARPGDSLPAGGGWHHLVAQGNPHDEIAAAMTLLNAAEGDPAARATLLRELRELDDGADLPHGIVHPDFVPANAILRPERGMVVVDWLGCGRGPRLWSLGFLLWAAGARDLALVDAVIGGYRQHVQLTPDELARLPDAIRARPLTIDCWAVAHDRLNGADAIERLDLRAERAEAIAGRVRGLIRS
jgi:Ser/Thr protein kinase RdoA (MazF antagonist)